MCAVLRVVHVHDMRVTHTCDAVLLGLAFNAVADALSRNQLESARCLARKEFGVPLCLV
jgi:hypothetical protein